MKSHIEVVSIGVPTYNRPQGLQRTLSCLSAQTYPYLEILVSDNCSPSKETLMVVADAAEKDSRIHYFRQEKLINVTENFRFVLRQATGQYFMWAADDDEWAPNFVLSCLDSMSNNSVSAMSAFDTHYRRSGIRKRASMPALSPSSNIADNLSAFMSHLTPSLFYGVHRRNSIEFFLHDTVFDFYDCYFVMKLITSGGISLVPESLFVAGIDNEEYVMKTAGRSWGSGLRFLPFYRATRRLLNEVVLAKKDRVELELKLALLVLRLAGVNEGRAILNKAWKVIA